MRQKKRAKPRKTKVTMLDHTNQWLFRPRNTLRTQNLVGIKGNLSAFLRRTQNGDHGSLDAFL